MAKRVKRAKYNFGAASRRDSIVHGASGAGYIHPSMDTPRTPRGPPVPEKTVSAWLAFLKHKKIETIISLLTEAELNFYASEYVEACKTRFEFLHVSPSAPDIMQQVLSLLNSCEKKERRVIVHCASGQKRTGDILALWLHHKYFISVEAAVKEVKQHASEISVLRRPTVDGVMDLLAPSSSGLLSARRALVPQIPSLWAAGHTPRPAVTRNKQQLHMTIVQMGGHIDLDYSVHPQGIVGKSAANNILNSMLVGFSYDFVSVSNSLTQPTSDQLKDLHDVCAKTPATKILITHGLDSIIKTGQYLRGSFEHKTIILTGAVWPHAMKRTDASFNIGVALGALSVLRRGCYICMNGRVFDASRCRRDPTSGLFYMAAVTKASAASKGKPVSGRGPPKGATRPAKGLTGGPPGPPPRPDDTNR